MATMPAVLDAGEVSSSIGSFANSARCLSTVPTLLLQPSPKRHAITVIHDFTVAISIVGRRECLYDYCAYDLEDYPHAHASQTVGFSG
jgi:hypothetical protein